MKKLLLAALALALASSAAAGGTRAESQPRVEAEETARQALYDRVVHDHPLAEPVSNPRVAIRVVTDRIMRSCCRPPDLVISGHVTNLARHPIDYVKLLFAFEDRRGRVLHAETVYNSKAVSMADSPEIERILNEKPHFTPIPPGASDTFTFSIPLPLLPKFAKVELYANDARR